jgi:hypothetical protein
MSIVLGEVAWWAPLAIVGGALLGAVFGYALLAAVGVTRRPAEADRLSYERTDRTNYPRWNPAAFLVGIAVVGLIAGLAIGLALD